MRNFAIATRILLPMIVSRVLALVATTVIASVACSRQQPGDQAGAAAGDPGAVTAATLGAQVVLPTPDYLKLPEYQQADREYGARLTMQCRACHSFERHGPSISGPNLYGVFGRPAGGVDGYPYSPALADADFIWTPEALDAWLERPMRFLPGNRMAYPGLPDQEDRAALIAELLRITDDSGPEDDG